MREILAHRFRGADLFLNKAGADVVAVDSDQAHAARGAFSRFGRFSGTRTSAACSATPARTAAPASRGSSRCVSRDGTPLVAARRSRKQLESLLAEVSSEGERAGQMDPAHDLEAGTVDETEIPAGGAEQRAERDAMDLLVDLQRPDGRQHVPVEHAYCLEAKPALNQRERFHQHVIRAEERLARLEKLAPHASGRRMMLVVCVEHREERRRIDEDAHPRYASSRYRS